MLTEEIISAFSGELTPKFLATLSAEGIPNVVPIISLTAPDPATLVFGEFMVWKTRKNLNDNPRVCALVLTEDLRLWSVRGDFVEFQGSGPYVDMLNEKTMFRYNAYLGIRRAGVIRVRDVAFHARLSRASLMVDILAARLVRGAASRNTGGGARAMPAPVMEKFSRLKSVRVFSALGRDRYPAVVPALSMVPAGAETLVFIPGMFSRHLEPLAGHAPCAASVITFDPVAYQVKGTWSGIRSFSGIKFASMKIREIYSASPPRPGEKIA